jgi:hypothetical protein
LHQGASKNPRYRFVYGEILNRANDAHVGHPDEQYCGEISVLLGVPKFGETLESSRRAHRLAMAAGVPTAVPTP